MKKTKKHKNVKVSKRGKLNSWLAALGVFAGVSVICGGTVFGVYLSGGFEEKVIYPESIAFEYDDDKFNNGQLEIGVSENFNPEEIQTFELKITSPTQVVTRDKVTLSFVDQESYNTPDASGYISNTIIRLPQIVPLNQTFKVELLTENLKETELSTDYVMDGNNYIDWIKGGISTIQAQSADIEDSPIELTIAVDVPVYKVETQMVDADGDLIDQVVTNQSFYLKSKFIPAKSEYMFGDDKSEKPESEWRTKKTFFESKNTNVLTPYYEDKYTIRFDVGNNAENGIVINGYPYRTAYSQIAIEKQLPQSLSNLDYYISMLEGVAGIVPTNQIAKTTINIGQATVGSYTIASQSMDMEVGKKTRIFMNKYDYYADSEFLNANVYSSFGALLDGMLSNLAIAFVDNGADATIGANAVVSVDGGDNEDNFIVYEGIKYYLPTTSGSSARYSFWDINPLSEKNLIIKTILFEEKDSVMVPFKSSGEVMSFPISLELKAHKEKAVQWLDNSDINILLEYDEKGEIDPHTINHLSTLTSIPSQNIYQDVIFFAYFGALNKEDYIEKANSVFGESGYNVEKSGVYATEQGNLTLFAIEGHRITLYNTGEFSLYFATVVAQNGKYEYDNAGLYQIVEMSENYINVSCEKSLNDQSITAAVLDTTNFIIENNETSISQGSELTFAVRFTVGKESVPVFKDELDQGFINPRILDLERNDITSLFVIDSVSFNIEEGGEGILEYNFKVKSAVQIEDENGIYLGHLVLNYNDNSSKNITWEKPLADDQNVCLYKPVSRLIEIEIEDEFAGVLNGTNKVNVEQSLQPSGEFATKIIVQLGPVQQELTKESLLQKLVGANGARVKITDQKGKNNTLQGQWMFEVVEGNGDVINISADGQSFVFKNTNESVEEVALSVVSKDENVSTGKIVFSIVSKGIEKMAFNSTNSTYDTTITEDDKTSDLSLASVQKYGAKGNANDYIVLKNLIKFYLSNDVEYSKVNFKFSLQTISSKGLSDTQITDLFGRGEDNSGGMLTLYTYDSETQRPVEIDFNGDYGCSNIRSVLEIAEIYQIRINKDFAVGETLKFIISDKDGSVNTSFDLGILPNISVSNKNYPNADAQFTDGKLYAEKEYTITNSVTNYNSDTTNGTFASSLYDGTQYYVVNNNQRYVLTATNPGEGSYIATFRQGTISFIDFWDEEEKEFKIYFQPHGINTYTLNKGIDFTVSRNLNIQSANAAFYVIGTGSASIEEFVSVQRKAGDSAFTNLELNYEFENYLDFSKEDELAKQKGVSKKNGTDFFFDYNQQQLSTVLTVSYINAAANKTILSQIPVKIKLYKPNEAGETEDIYQEIAKVLRADGTSGINAEIQIVNNIEYIVVDISSQDRWKLSSADSAFDGCYLVPSNKNYYKNSMIDTFEVTGVSDLTIGFKQKNNLLYGLGDSNVYLVVNIESNAKTLATLHLPLIISRIGYESVIYTDGDSIPAANKQLETALTTPEELINQNIYNKITAGQANEILKFYQQTDEVTTGGLYSLDNDNLMQTIKYYAFDSQEYKNHNNLIKGFNGTYTMLTLNHLAQNVEKENVYLAFEYTIEMPSVGAKQRFYYVLLVEPDIIVEKSVYAYNGTVEYITGAQDELKNINLESVFTNNTLNENYKRFNVSREISLVDIAGSTPSITLAEVGLNITSETARIKFSYSGKDDIIKTFNRGEIICDLSSEEFFDSDLSKQNKLKFMIMEGDASVRYNGIEVLRTLKFINEIASVKIDDDPELTDRKDWYGKVELDFSPDFSTLYYKAKSTSKIEIKLKHSYVGSANDTDLSVVGGEQYYTLILNGSDRNYTVKFELEGGEETIATEYPVNLINDGENAFTDLTIRLIQNDSLGGDSSSGNIITGLLQVQVIDGEEFIKDYNYANMTGEFKLEMLEYITSNKTVNFAIFTEEGFLAKLVVNLKANAEVSLKANNVLNGGTSTPFADIFNVKLDDDFTTKYSVVAEAKGDHKNLVDWNNGIIEVADLIEAKEVTFDFVVTFLNDDGSNQTFTNKAGETENKTFAFSYTFSLEANITKAISVSATNTIAGQKHEIELDKLYTGTLDASTTVILEVSSSSSAVEVNSLTYNEETEEWDIETNYVGGSVPVTLNITVNFYYGYAKDADGKVSYDAKQKFEVTYSFVVEPSVSIDPNYPNPTNAKELEFEFVDDGATFSEILDNFFAKNPIFNNEKEEDIDAGRIVVKGYNTTAGDYITTIAHASLNTADLSIVLSNLQNASLAYNSGRYQVNSEIAPESEIIFKRGTYSESKDSYNDVGTDSIVEFTITYQAVSKTYKVYILSNSLTVKLNTVSNYTTSGTYNNSTVNYETIYVDKTSTSNMFARERLVYLEMSASMKDFANEYYLVFSEEDATDNTTYYYASYPIYFSEDDQAKNLYFDLGVSMAGKTFEGAYLTSALEKAGLGLDSENKIFRTETEVIDGVPTSKQISITEIPSDFTDFANNLFDQNTLTLANRVQLVYGQIDGKDILVDYEWYSTNVSELNVQNTYTIDNIYVHSPISQFARNDGSGENDSFVVNYYFKPNIDIEVAEEATEKINYASLEVNAENPSLVNLFGVRHQTSKQIVSPSTFATGTTSLAFEVIEYKYTYLDTLADKYLEALRLTEFNKSLDGKNDYLFYAEVKNASNKICDYTLLALGAKNGGDFVLGEITYTSGEFEKIFYVVINIMPDYVISFGESTSNSTIETDGVVSNVNNIRTISQVEETDGSVYYNDFDMTGENGFISVKHKNGSNTNLELSSRNFNISMPINHKYDATEYNNEANIKEKIFYEESENKTLWLQDRSYSIINIDKKIDEIKDATFKNVKEVIFANQYYMIEGVDAYGFTFRAYFLLQATGTTPAVAGQISLMENGYFDVGAKYQYLTIEKEESSEDGLYINSISKNPEIADANVSLVTIQGMEAWIFDKDYTLIPDEYLVVNANGGYTVNSDKGYDFDETDKAYFNLPKFANTTITRIDIYDAKNPEICLTGEHGLTKPTLEDGSLPFATASSLIGYFNGFNPRGAYTLGTDEGEDANKEKLWHIPRIENTDIFDGSDSANVLMIIQLKYENGGITEVYNCPVNVNLIKEIQVSQTENSVVVDGQAINLLQHFTKPEIMGEEDPSFINDTLEILVQANGTASFEMKLMSGGQKKAEASLIIPNTGKDFARTEYISLSQYFHKNVNIGDTVEITNVQGVDNFFYITNSDSSTTTATTAITKGENETYTVEIGEITNDYVYIENASLLSQKSYYNVTKYYIMNCKIDGTDYRYRVQRQYVVTALYYQMNAQFTSEIGFALEGNAGGQIVLENWRGNAFALYNAKIEGGVVTKADSENTGSANLQFLLDKTEAAVAGMTIGNATIGENDGKITLGVGFSNSQYIKVVINVEVSGADRDLSNHSNATYHNLGILNLAKVRAVNS